MDATSLTWITGGDAPWFSQTNITHDGVDAACSGAIGDAYAIGYVQSTWLETTVTAAEPSAVSFWWKVSSLPSYRALQFSINGVVQTSISGEVDWQQRNFGFGAGTNVLRWTYTQVVVWPPVPIPWRRTWSDAGWLDEVTLVAPSPPAITRQPPCLEVAAPGTATLVVAASGTEPRAYQWRKDGTDLTDGPKVSGATGPALTLSNLSTNDSGLYSVVITSAYGTVTSSNGCLAVLPPLSQRGSWPGYARGDAMGVFVTNGLAFVAQGAGGLGIFDVSTPASPRPLGGCGTSGSAARVQVVGHLAYVAAGSAGLEIVDISNPASPVHVGAYTGMSANAVQVQGSLAYVAGNSYSWPDDQTELRVLDVSNPTNPVPLAGFGPGGNAQDVQVVGNLAFVAAGSAGLQIFDLSNPTNQTPLGSNDTSGYAYAVQVVGNLAFVADGDAGLQVIDVSNPSTPVWWGNLDTGGNAGGVQVAGPFAYVADGDGGLQIIDVSNPGNPVPAGGYDTSGYAYGVQVVGDLAYVADGWAGLVVVKVGNSASPVGEGGCGTSASTEDVQVVGNLAYVADGSAGLRILDVSDPANPVQVGGFGMGGYVRRVQVAGSLAYVADGSTSLRIIEVSNPSNPVLVGSYNTGGTVRCVRVVGSLAYVLADNVWFSWPLPPMPPMPLDSIDDPALPVAPGAPPAPLVPPGGISLYSGNELQIIAVKDPAQPVFVGSASLGGFSHDSSCDLQVNGSLAYVTDQDGVLLWPDRGRRGRLQVIDVSNPASPVALSRYSTSGAVQGVQVVGSLAYVADGSAGLQIFDVSNPANAVRVGGCDTAGDANGIQVLDNLAYVADGSAGLQVIDVSNPASPVWVGGFDTSGYGYGVQVVGSLAYVADGNWGLAIIETPFSSAVAATGQYGDLAYSSDGSAITITGYTGAGGAVAIPAAINGLPVTSIGTLAFAGCTNLTGVFFKGNAPRTGVNLFLSASNAIVYYLPGTTGWGARFADHPALLWNPLIQTTGPSFGVGAHGFGFMITGTPDIPIVVEAILDSSAWLNPKQIAAMTEACSLGLLPASTCSNLANLTWMPLQTGTLTNGSFSFSDPQWTNYPTRFYRLRSP